ncbi:MAG: alpha/beta hydrolase-fold protein [Alicyclobacillaceae bacterium]|jgi:enterochelin esterase-like enzyme|uniref:alpha/beta hydrolase n=1 Tax=Alicyclobacillus sp. SP_1 TaxID=2942475 RepID=UPI002157C229|nr:alpha/beta hydrolase-fold protein [Alicyclobacillus sp. SP_1]MCY0886844.1 alpha/beta hydrolase-fold protein [Alicyclobacillaceae bacterium]MCY0895154.1 alpha/beta hydrolase-fold protein [Alicyclobacillaceae bacterium]
MSVQRTIEAHELHSEILGEERTVKVYLPPGYDPQVAYPVLYCHDGLEFFTHGRVATLVQELIVEQAVRPVLIVGIAVHLKERNNDYAMNGSRHEKYCQFVIEECIPFIEDHYSVRPEERSMAGISLGAVATLSLVLQNPGFFRHLMLFSGAYFPYVQESLRMVADLSAYRAYMVVGSDEWKAETPGGTFDFLTYNRQMRDLLLERGMDVDYREEPGNHVWGFWQRLLPNGLRWWQGVSEQ